MPFYWPHYIKILFYYFTLIANMVCVVYCFFYASLYASVGGWAFLLAAQLQYFMFTMKQRKLYNNVQIVMYL